MVPISSNFTSASLRGHFEYQDSRVMILISAPVSIKPKIKKTFICTLSLVFDHLKDLPQYRFPIAFWNLGLILHVYAIIKNNVVFYKRLQIFLIFLVSYVFTVTGKDWATLSMGACERPVKDFCICMALLCLSVVDLYSMVKCPTLPHLLHIPEG